MKKCQDEKSVKLNKNSRDGVTAAYLVAFVSEWLNAAAKPWSKRI